MLPPASAIIAATFGEAAGTSGIVHAQAHEAPRRARARASAPRRARGCRCCRPRRARRRACRRTRAGCCEQRGERRGAGALGDGLLDLDAAATTARSIVSSSTSSTSSTQRAHDRERRSRRRPSPRCPRRSCRRRPRPAGPPGAGASTGSSATRRRRCAIPGSTRLRRDGDARDQAAAADRDHQRVEIGRPARASRAPTVPWPAITSGSSYGCTKTRPLARGERARVRARLAQVSPSRTHLGAVHLRVLAPSCSACRAA